MHEVLEFFADNGVLVLFTLIGVGMIFGYVRIKGIGLGAAAVLFTAMAFSAYSTSHNVDLILDHKIGILGLALFAFAIGINSGPNFFHIIKHSFGPILALVVILSSAGAIAYLIGHYVFHMSPALIGGTFAGAVTNTPSLSAVGNASGNMAEATVGYAISYLYGVIGMLFFSYLGLQYGKRDKDKPTELISETIRVVRKDNPHISDIRVKYGYQVKFTRIARGENEPILHPRDHDELHCDDLVTVVGTQDLVKEVERHLGHESSHSLIKDRSFLDFRRITVSNPKFSGRKLKDLDLDARFNATISRVRRGDVDMFANPNLRLQQGDRVRVVAPHGRLKEISAYFGDSSKGMIDINPIALGFGMMLGILIGEIPILTPSGADFSIGSAAGTLIVGLIFGRLGRIGPFVLTIPYTVCQVLAEFGLIVFLAQAGTNAGQQIANAFTSDIWWKSLVLGVVVTTFIGLGLYIVMRYMFKMGGTRLSGLVGGAQTQPAVLAFANNATNNDARIALGYAMVYPVAMIVKILIGQVLGSM